MTLNVQPDAAWRAAVGVLAGLAAAAAAAWIPGAYGPLSVLLWSGLLLTAGAAIVSAWRLRALPAVELHWDGRQWFCTEGGRAPCLGTLVVALDLGAWMLLAFRGDGAPGPRWRWIPVQRRGVGEHWHALRCAVYSPRSAPGGSPAAASPTPSE